VSERPASIKLIRCCLFDPKTKESRNPAHVDNHPQCPFAHPTDGKLWEQAHVHRKMEKKYGSKVSRGANSMSSTTLSIGPSDPAYYADLLQNTTSLVDRHVLSDGSCPTIPGIKGIDNQLRRLQTLLDDIASISLRKRGNVSATMACLKYGDSTLKTQLYIIFNHQDDSYRLCLQHLKSIFRMLKQVPYKTPEMDGSPQLIMGDFKTEFLEICTVIHNYSFSIFAYRVNKHRNEISNIRELIEKERSSFSSNQHSSLLSFLRAVEMIMDIVSLAEAEKTKFSIAAITMIHSLYLRWTKMGLLLEDPLADNTVTLLDTADVVLAQKGVRFRLQRWALKIMSFVISTNRLFRLTQSPRLRKLLDGAFDVEVLSSPTAKPYRCNLSRETVQMALDAALPETNDVTTDQKESRQLFITECSKVSPAIHKNPTVHAELALIIAMVKRGINHLPYIGVSKLSCIMCSHYIHVFGETTGRKVFTRGSHGKAYPGWGWPCHPNSGRDEALHRAFIAAIRAQLSRDLGQVAARRNSDSSVGSNGVSLEMDETEDEVFGMIEIFIKQGRGGKC